MIRPARQGSGHPNRRLFRAGIRIRSDDRHSFAQLTASAIAKSPTTSPGIQ